MKIGIPSGLLYFSYFPLWKTFYEELGAEVVLSGPSNKVIMDYGVKLCVDEACLPVKIYHGHVESLKSKVDALFIPRIMSVKKNEYICPKFCGLPEMIKNSVPDLPHIVDTIVNLRKSPGDIVNSAMDGGSIITKDRKRIMKAYEDALKAQKIFEERIKETGSFEGSLRGEGNKAGDKCRKIALIGHPYNVYDGYANMSIIKKLEKFGFSVITPEMVDEDRINRNAALIPKRHFWTFGRRVLGMGLSFIENHDVDGIIYLSSFGCGIDSLMEDYLERKIREDGKIPYMKLILDEHSGEAGTDTRIEAFIDMVSWREENEGNFSTYGRSMCSSKSLS